MSCTESSPGPQASWEKDASCFLEPWTIGEVPARKKGLSHRLECVTCPKEGQLLPFPWGGGGERKRFLVWRSPSEFLRLDYLQATSIRRGQRRLVRGSLEHHLTCQVTEGDRSRGKMGRWELLLPRPLFSPSTAEPLKFFNLVSSPMSSRLWVKYKQLLRAGGGSEGCPG